MSMAAAEALSAADVANACAVCRDSPCHALFLPCGHAALCESCLGELFARARLDLPPACPLCQCLAQSGSPLLVDLKTRSSMLMAALRDATESERSTQRVIAAAIVAVAAFALAAPAQADAVATAGAVRIVIDAAHAHPSSSHITGTAILLLRILAHGGGPASRWAVLAVADDERLLIQRCATLPVHAEVTTLALALHHAPKIGGPQAMSLLVRLSSASQAPMESSYQRAVASLLWQSICDTLLDGAVDELAAPGLLSFLFAASTRAAERKCHVGPVAVALRLALERVVDAADKALAARAVTDGAGEAVCQVLRAAVEAQNVNLGVVGLALAVSTLLCELMGLLDAADAASAAQSVADAGIFELSTQAICIRVDGCVRPSWLIGCALQTCSDLIKFSPALRDRALASGVGDAAVQPFLRAAHDDGFVDALTVTEALRTSALGSMTMALEWHTRQGLQVCNRARQGCIDESEAGETLRASIHVLRLFCLLTEANAHLMSADNILSLLKCASCACSVFLLLLFSGDISARTALCRHASLPFVLGRVLACLLRLSWQMAARLKLGHAEVEKELQLTVSVVWLVMHSLIDEHASRWRLLSSARTLVAMMDGAIVSACFLRRASSVPMAPGRRVLRELVRLWAAILLAACIAVLQTAHAVFCWFLRPATLQVHA